MHSSVTVSFHCPIQSTYLSFKILGHFLLNYISQLNYLIEIRRNRALFKGKCRGIVLVLENLRVPALSREHWQSVGIIVG